jgi:predicted DNA-binding transcriptional regulator AlpA
VPEERIGVRDTGEWPELMTTREVARVLRLREKTLYHWATDTGAPLRPVRIRSGSRHLVRWRRADVLALLNGSGAA